MLWVSESILRSTGHKQLFYNASLGFKIDTKLIYNFLLDCRMNYQSICYTPLDTSKYITICSKNIFLDIRKAANHLKASMYWTPASLTS